MPAAPVNMNPAKPSAKRVAIIDYGLGNLFSVLRACHVCDMEAFITRERADVAAADAVILPGVGAFGDAVATLQELGLFSTLEDVAASGKPLMGICLGLQLLFSESHEFGRHRGLNLIEGSVMRLADASGSKDTPMRVPHIGWNRVEPAGDMTAWGDSPLRDVAAGAFMYFVHSYHAVPAHPEDTIAATRWGSVVFASGVRRNNVFGFQFHPERSGVEGLKIYQAFGALIR